MQGVEAMSFTVQLPHNWKEGTTIFPHLHWMPKATASSGNVEWNFDYTWANYNSTTPEVIPGYNHEHRDKYRGFNSKYPPDYITYCRKCRIKCHRKDHLEYSYLPYLA